MCQSLLSSECVCVCMCQSLCSLACVFMAANSRQFNQFHCHQTSKRNTFGQAQRLRSTTSADNNPHIHVSNNKPEHNTSASPNNPCILPYNVELLNMSTAANEHHQCLNITNA